MKRALLASAAALLVASGCSDVPVVTDPFTPGDASVLALPADVVPGRFIVTLRDGSSPAAIAREHGVSPDFLYSRVLTGFAGSMSEAARTGLLRDARVLRVEPDGIARTMATQSPATWGLDRIDQRNLPLNNSYTYNATGSGVTVYIIDTGIRFSHSEFGGRATSGWDFVDNDSNASDCNGHGTHVAGTVGGATYGVAKQVSLVGVRVLNCSGSGTWSGVIAGMDWVAANKSGPSVANMSLGGGASSSVDAALRRLIQAGVQTAVAAGNGNIGGKEQDACGYSPARVLEAITIGATTQSDSKTSWSNYGNCVDFFAPGSGITSAWYTSNTDTRTISGTSMAAPHVAGAAALYLQGNSSATPQQVRDALYAATTKGIVTNSKTVNNHLLFVGSTEPPPPPVATTVAAASPTSQEAEAGTNVSAPPSVIVRDQFNNPMSGVTVAFEVTSGGGAITPASGVTGSDGRATATSWTLGSTPGSNTATATVSGLTPVTFNATGTEPGGGGGGGGEEPGDAPPFASFTYTCSGFTCNFTSTSTDDFGISGQEWTSTLGGQPQSGTTAVFTSGAKRNFTVTLVVTDTAGQTSSASRSIRCNPNFCQ